MSETATILDTKRANARLKPVGDVCLEIAAKRYKRSLDKARTLMLARPDREIKPEDQLVPELRQAVEAFWQGVDSKQPLPPLADAVYRAVRRVQRQRWVRVRAEHGEIRHYFDAFGQVKPRYRKKIDARPRVRLPLWVWIDNTRILLNERPRESRRLQGTNTGKVDAAELTLAAKLTGVTDIASGDLAFA